MTPAEIIAKASVRLGVASSAASVGVAQDIGIGAIGALLDLGVINVHEWRTAIDELDEAAARIVADAKCAPTNPREGELPVKREEKKPEAVLEHRQGKHIGWHQVRNEL